MKIGIIEAGAPPVALAATFGSYVTMTQCLLGHSRHDYEPFCAFDGILPRPEQCDAFIVTGSACSVYDDKPWISQLEEFLQAARGRAKLIGICFGHQIMAQAFGGKVERAPQGWGLGLHRYDIKRHEAWMDNTKAIRAIASHQDQVTTLPRDSHVLGASAFTPNAILAYRSCRALSVQFHPEFTPAFAKALIEARRGTALGDDVLERAIASTSEPNDNARIGLWLNKFLTI